ncbi:MAG: hypothetical protein FWH40_09230 [Coriobacteriia bacterium]|nr:hypothetical protein [Coriobacteriia bacterium]
MKKRTTASFTWFVSLIVCIALLMASAGCSSAGTNSNSSSGDNKSKKDDLSDIAKEYTLSAGHYTAGIDIPVGKANIIAVSGRGSLSSSNMLSGGINQVFGIDDGSGVYASEFKNLVLSENVKLHVTMNLVIKLTFTKIEAGFTGRAYDKAKAIELSRGNYTAGTDFPAGVYTINAVSGNGSLYSSNLLPNCVNEAFGVDTSTGFYIDQFINAELGDGVTLTITGSLKVRLTPVK